MIGGPLQQNPIFVPVNPASCAQTTSTSGFRRNKPLMILRFRFSSPRNASCRLRFSRQKPAPNFRQRRTKFDLVDNEGFMLAHGIEISFDLVAASEIERDHGVHVCQTHGRVLLADFFRSGTLLESLDQSEECDSSIGYTADTMCIKAKRRRNGFDGDARHDARMIPSGEGITYSERRSPALRSR
jgi:hypothetical protein